MPSGHPALLLAQPDAGPLAQVADAIDRMVVLARKGDEQAARAALESQTGTRLGAEAHAAQ